LLKIYAINTIDISKCLGKSAQEKKFNDTYYRAEYEKNNKRVKSFLGKRTKTLHSSTVEPVFGSLIQDRCKIENLDE